MNSFTTQAAILILAGSAFLAAQNYTISTIAGGAPPPTNVPAINAAAGKPTSVAADRSGNVYYTSLNCIFKVDTKGILTRIAGTSRADYSGDGGPAINAALNQPNGLAIDSKGNIFVSDFGNYRIRLITPDGKINTFAGTGNAGSGGDGGPALSATFTAIHGMALDSVGNLLVSDFGADVVRKIAFDGSNIVTFAGVYGVSGYAGDAAGATLANLNHPSGVAIAPSGSVYIADTGNQVIRIVTTDGNIATYAGNNTSGAGYAGDNGAATSAQLNTPESLVIDKAGSLYIADYANAVIRIVIPSGTIGTYAGTGSSPGFSGDGGAAASAQLNGVFGMAIDAAGNFYIADYFNYRIRKINTSNVITSIAGGGLVSFSGDGGPATLAVMGTPYGVAVDPSGNVYFSDYENFRVRKISASGVITTIAGNGTPGFSGDGGLATKAQLYPTGLALDPSGNLYIADFVNNVVRKVFTNGTITTYAGNRGLGTGYAGDGGLAINAQLNYPSAVALDGQGNLFIADWGNFVIRRVTPFGLISTVAGTNLKGYGGDGGAGINAQLGYVNGLATDAAGNLYIADWDNFRIRKLNTSLAISTIAGNGNQGYSGDGLSAISTGLGNPYGIVVDAAGNVYFADSFDSRIRKIDTHDIITSIGGEGDNGYTGDSGPASLAEIFYPYGLALDSNGSFYFADSQNKAIRKLTVGGNSINVTNSASNQITAVTPGEIVTLYGSGMGPDALVQATPVSGAYPAQLAGTQVLINGVAAPMIYSSSKQVAAVVPFDVTGANLATIQVRYNGQTQAPFNLPVKASSPGIFSSDQSGAGQAAALNQDTSVNSAQNPARHGSVVVLYATGDGQTNPGGVNGLQVQVSGVLPHPMLPVSVTIGGIPATVQYAGAAPAQVAGLMQLNVVIPNGVVAGNAVPVVLTVGSGRSQSGITIAVAAN